LAARALARPQERRSRRARQTRAMTGGHPPARAVLERRRRIEAVEARQPRTGARREGAVARERLVDVQHVRGLTRERLRHEAPRAEDRALDEPRDRAAIGRELTDPHTLTLERGVGRGLPVPPAPHAPLVAPPR